MGLLGWLRRLVVSMGIGGFSYLIMLGIMILSVVYDREFEPVIRVAFDIGRGIVNGLDTLVSGSHWGQVAVNHLRERVNLTHVVLSIPAITISTILCGIPLNKLLGGTRSGLQRLAIALTTIPSTVVLAVVLFSFNAMFPEAYSGLLRFADWIWRWSLDALSASDLPGALKLANAARQGFSGHHYVLMALCSMVAAFTVNAIFVLASRESSVPRPRPL
jgi:hypothetical protein